LIAAPAAPARSRGTFAGWIQAPTPGDRVADDAGSHDDSVLAIEALGLVDTLLEAL
jgi:hypothetical protein